MKIVSLISAVDQNIDAMLSGMRLETDAVLVNQLRDGEHAVDSCGIKGSDTSGRKDAGEECSVDSCSVAGSGASGQKDAGSPDPFDIRISEITSDDHHIRCITMHRRGVGLSRNTCIDNCPDCDICLFTDEDIVYDQGYSDKIIAEYEAHPEADAILFNMRVCEGRRTYWNEQYDRVRFYNYGRYPAYSISIRKEKLDKSRVHFPLEFGGGAKYINGEDSVFLHDLLKAGVKIYKSPVCLGEETERESTWFKGYTDDFFISRGALYVRLYGVWAKLRAHIFLIRHKDMYKDRGYASAYGLMKKGMNEYSG